MSVGSLRVVKSRGGVVVFDKVDVVGKSETVE